MIESIQLAATLPIFIDLFLTICQLQHGYALWILYIATDSDREDSQGILFHRQFGDKEPI
jgi:hypothetical protein